MQPVIPAEALLGAVSFLLLAAACTAVWCVAAVLVLTVRYFLRR